MFRQRGDITKRKKSKFQIPYMVPIIRRGVLAYGIDNHDSGYLGMAVQLYV